MQDILSPCSPASLCTEEGKSQHRLDLSLGFLAERERCCILVSGRCHTVEQRLLRFVYMQNDPMSLRILEYHQLTFPWRQANFIPVCLLNSSFGWSIENICAIITLPHVLLVLC